MSTPFDLQIPCRIHEEMLRQAQAELPHECCGLLAGRLVEENGRAVGKVLRRYPLVNAAASPVEYLSDPQSLFEAIRDMRKHDMEVLAIYHSHPTSDPVPSVTDLARNNWPGAMCLIISLKAGEPVLRGWWLEENDFREGKWELIEDRSVDV